MAQFRSTADIMDLALRKGGEVTNGNSPYETSVLDYLNRVHIALIAGGTIPIGQDATVEINETWSWAKATSPLVIELQPAYTLGNVTITRGNEAGTFYPAPPQSLVGYHLFIQGREEIFKIVKHEANETTFEIDSAYPDESVTQVAFKAFRLDYVLQPGHIFVTDRSNKIQFQKTAGVTITGTLTKGVYSPADFATHVAEVMTTAAFGPTITGSYSEITGKFTLTSDGAGSTTLLIVGNGTQSFVSAHKLLGFDDETSSASLTQESTYVLGGIARLVEPFRIYKGTNANVTSIDSESFHRDYALNRIQEGLPDRFCVLSETHDGLITVRFNKYVTQKTRIEVERVEVPRDLKDNSSSIPLVPRKYVDVLEDAATFYLMLDKSDDRMQMYSGLLKGKLQAMITQNRSSLRKTGKFFGQTIARRDRLDRFQPNFVTTPYSEPQAVAGTVQTLIQETLSYSDFSAAATTKSVTVRTLGANRTLFSILIKHSQSFTGGSVSALTLSVGITGDEGKFIGSFDVYQSVASSAQDSVLTVYYPGVATDITVTATSTGANLSDLTQGSVDIYFLESIVG